MVNRVQFLSALILLTACSADGAAPPEGEDTQAPVVQVSLAPDAGDGLLRLEIHWDDGANPLSDPTIRIVGSRGTLGSAATTGDVAGLWRVLRRDASNVLIGETGGALLPAGTNELEVTVTDQAGNTGTAKLRVELPRVQWHTRYALGGEGGLANVVACDEEPLVYIPGFRRMIIIDPNVGYLRSLLNPYLSETSSAICARDEPAIYLASGVQRFDRDIIRFGTVSPFQATRGAYSIAQGVDPIEELYLGYSDSRIVVADRMSGRPLRTIQLTNSHPEALVAAILVLKNTSIVAGLHPGGLRVLDRGGTELRTRDGTVRDLRLDRTGTRVFAALDADGVAEIDPQTLATLQSVHLPGGAKAINLRSDQKLALITAADANAEANYLFDLDRWEIIGALPRSSTGPRIDSGGAWEYNGRRLFIAYSTPEGAFIDVYLDRS